ncbi:MAG: ABC transporter permease [Desulfobulbaceae bacterium]|nr:ABC transporter permease [Desulfobulbaceae bacterium]
MGTAVLVFLGTTFLTYGMMSLAPGDAPLEIAMARYGESGLIDQTVIDWIIEKEGLNKPFYQRYYYWLSHAVQLDFGMSLVEEVPVWELIKSRFSRTFDLAVAAIILALIISIPLGILSGLRQGTWIDSMGTAIAVTGVSMPSYWLGPVLIVIFSVKLQWLPSFGRGDWQHMALPTITLGTALTAYTTRILRSAIIESLQSDYLLALRARGVGSRLIISSHVLKNAMIPVVTVVGLELGMIFEGAVITETVFAWPGLGALMVSAVSNRDYPLIQGIVLFTAIIFVLINFLVDIAYQFLDPRIRPS